MSDKEKNSNNIEEEINASKLIQDTSQVLHSIIQEEDPTKIKDLTHLFNLNIAKKNALRVSKLNDLLDRISEGMSERLEKRPDEFSNKDLIDYMNAINNAIEKAQMNTKIVDELPAITYNQQNNNQVNININSELPRESREKITQAIESIMSKLNTSQDNIEYNIENQIKENIENDSSK